MARPEPTTGEYNEGLTAEPLLLLSLTSFPKKNLMFLYVRPRT